MDGELGESYKAFFTECNEEIKPLLSHSKLAVRDPASKVLKKLGLSGVTKSAAKSKVVTQTIQPQENLLEFDSPDKAPREQDLIGGSAPAPSTIDSGNDLFGGLIAKQPKEEIQKPENVVQDTEDVFANMTMNDTSKVESKQNNGPSSSSGFGFMNAGRENVHKAVEPTATEQATAVSTEHKSPIPDSKSFDPLLSLSATPQTSNIKSAPAYPMMQMQMNPQMMYPPQQNGIMPPQSGIMAMPQQIPRQNVMLQSGSAQYFHLNVPQQKKEDTSFDFVKDVVKSAK